MAALASLIWFLICLLVVVWIVGLIAHIGGGLIHILLVVAIILFIANMLGRGRSAA